MEHPIICGKCASIMNERIRYAIDETRKAFLSNKKIVSLAMPLVNHGYTFKDACQAVREEMNK